MTFDVAGCHIAKDNDDFKELCCLSDVTTARLHLGRVYVVELKPLSHLHCSYEQCLNYGCAAMVRVQYMFLSSVPMSQPCKDTQYLPM